MSSTQSLTQTITDRSIQLTSPTLASVDYDAFLSVESASRYPSPLKALSLKYLYLPGMMSFGGGLPHPSTFPVSSMKLSFPYLSQEITVSGHAPPSSITFESHSSAEHPETDLNLTRALQYGGSSGAIQLITFLKEHTRRIAKIPYEDWDLIMTSGNTDGMDNVLRMLASRGSNVLVENFCYPGTVAAMEPQGIKPIGVKMDSEGMMPDDLDKILEGWDVSTQGKKPSLVVFVPTGSNPSGTTMSEERRREIYKVSQKHNLLILSDDPYRNLQLHYPDEKPTVPATSFLTLDTDGRVIDLSSFSKTVAPGCRCGWITAPKKLIERLALRNEVSLQAVSGFSVTAILSFLGGLGGQEGFEKYLAHVSKSYSARAHLMNQAFKKHLPADLCSWVLPSAGMFFYIHLKTAKHPLLSKLGPEGVLYHVFEKCIEEKIITVPSDLFKADPKRESTVDEISLRCSFSFVDYEEFDIGAKRMGDGIRKSFEATA